MRLLFLNNEFYPIGGGGSAVTGYLGRYLAQWGHQVHLITSSYKGLPRREVVEGIQVHRVPARRERRDSSSVFELLTYLLSASWYSLSLARTFKPELSHAFFALPAGAVAWFLHKRYAIPYCLYMGGSDVPGANPLRYGRLYPFITPWVKGIWKDASFVAAPSQRLVHLIRKVDPQAQVALIPNGVDLSRFKPLPQSQDGIVRILGVGRLIPRKGFQYVVESLPRIVEKSNGGFLFQIVGTGDYEGELRRLSQSLGVSQYLQFLGTVPYEELHRTYAAADIFVMPSLAEGMPLALLEAMACGLPVVASRVAGNEDVVQTGSNGYLVPPQDPKALAEALIPLLQDPSQRQTMGQRGLELIRPYDWRLIAEEYARVYRSLAAHAVAPATTS